MTMEKWRLVLDEAASGARNMAVDEALLLCHAAGDSLPTLRFYDWNPACISLGRFQKSLSLASQFDIVRRPTGGRAVLHQHEITYAAVLREELLPPDARSVVGAYRFLSAGLVEGLKRLGIEAALARGETESEGAANCFASSARCDFLVDGRKLIGAAQCRKQGAILQHGSILLRANAQAWEEALGGTMSGTVSLRDLGIVAPRAQIIEALGAGVAQKLGVEWEISALTNREEDVAHCLHKQKYACPDWNEAGTANAASLLTQDYLSTRL